MIDSEKNGMARLLQELKKGIRAEVESRRGADMNSEDNEKSNDDDGENCTTYPSTHSTGTLMSRHCVHTCIFPGVLGTRRIIENSFRSQLE